jgi:hypothetical protein
MIGAHIRQKKKKKIEFLSNARPRQIKVYYSRVNVRISA